MCENPGRMLLRKEADFSIRDAPESRGYPSGDPIFLAAGPCLSLALFGQGLQ